eukprot:ANDGO_04905.mRNA.1 hypothetical protein SAMD00019534_067540
MRRCVLVAALAGICVAVALATPIIPHTYPLYKQCDPRWGNDIMVTTTVCKVGCLMSSTSMAIGYHQITIDGQTSNPGTFNAWLKANGGYDSSNDFEETVVGKLNPSIQYVGPIHSGDALSRQDIQKMIANDKVALIFNVDQGHHFVLGTGWDSTNQDLFYVNDPGFDRAAYNYSDFVGYRVFGFN